MPRAEIERACSVFSDPCGALARVAWGAVNKAAQTLHAGDFTGLAGAMPHGELNSIFS